MTKQSKLIIFIFCILSLILHLIADYHSGFSGDELLHIETGNHLAFGYMEFPPLIGLLAFIQNLFHSQSIFIHHLFSHIAGLLIIVYVGKITFELGGKSIAVFIALFCLLVSPGFEGYQQLFEPVIFSQLFWIISFYQLVRYTKYNDKKYLWFLAILVSLFFLTKYDALFFSFGLLSLLIFKKTRSGLVKDKFWQCLLVGFLILLPNIIWQYANDWPALQMFGRLYETQLDEVTPLNILHDLFLSVNPIAFVFILPALVFMFIDKNNKTLYRPLSFSILLSVLFLLYSKGKAYYFFPIVLTTVPFCGVFWERVIQPKKNWLLYPLSFILLLGALLVPFGLPIYSFSHYLDTVHKYIPKKIKNGKEMLLLQQYTDKQKWKITIQELKSVYDSLPADERENCLIWGKHYSQAGAVELFRNSYELPNVFSYHGSFYSWAPLGEMPKTVIGICYNDAGNDFFNPFFEEVTPVKMINSDYSSSEGWVVQTIYVCKKPKQNFDKMKKLFKNRIFE